MNLFLRTNELNGTSHGGFKWPLEVGAVVECPDWNPEPVYGGGLHGLLWGEGDSSLLGNVSQKIAIVFSADEYVDCDAKCKVKIAKVEYVSEVGDIRKAANWMYTQLGGNIVGCYGTLEGGNGVMLKGGYGSTLTGGYGSTLTGGYGSTLTGRDRSTLTGGHHSTLTGGHHSTLTGRDRSTLTGRDRSTLTGRDSSTLTGGYRSTLTGRDYSTLTGGDYSTLTGGDYSTLTGGYGSTLTGGDCSVLIFQANGPKVFIVGKDCKPNVKYKYDGGLVEA